MFTRIRLNKMAGLFCRFVIILPCIMLTGNKIRRKWLPQFFAFSIPWMFLPCIIFIYIIEMVDSVFCFGNKVNPSPLHYVYGITIIQNMVESFCRSGNKMNASPMHYINENTIRQKRPAYFVSLEITWMLLLCILFTAIRFDRKMAYY